MKNISANIGVNDMTTILGEVDQNFDNALAAFQTQVKQYNSAYNGIGFARAGDSTPADVFGNVYLAMEAGTIFGIADVERGQWLVGTGSTGYTLETISDEVDGSKLKSKSVDTDSINDEAVGLPQMSQAAKDFIGSGGSVINNPDDVDLETKSGSVIGLKDGRRNGYEVRTISQLDSLISASQSGTYIIASDLVLDDNKTLPSGVTLEFRNSKISTNGFSLTGSYTKIKSADDKVFEILTDVLSEITGTWNVVEVYPEWFGAYGDDINDDIQPLQMANNFIYNCTNGGCISLSKGKTYMLGSTFYWDNSNVSIYGNRATLHSTISNGDFAIQTLKLEGSSYDLVGVIKELHLIGESDRTGNGINFGNSGSITYYGTTVENVAFEDFNIAIQIIDNAYVNNFNKIGFNHCNICVNLPSGSNLGERITFFETTFANSKQSIVANNQNGDCYLISCSIDFNSKQMIEVNAGHVNVISSHIEYSVSTFSPTNRPIVISNSNTANLNIINSVITCQGNNDNDLDYHIYNESTNQSGLLIRDTFYHNLQCTNELIGGTGINVIENLRTLTIESSQIIASRVNNIVSDGTFEQTTIVDNIVSYGSEFTSAEISTDMSLIGTQSLKIATTNGGGINHGIRIIVPIKGGFDAPYRFYMKSSTDSGYIEFSHRYGIYRDGEIKNSVTVGAGNTNTSDMYSDWKIFAASGGNRFRYPTWATHLILQINLFGFNSSSGTYAIYIDDLVVNTL